MFKALLLLFITLFSSISFAKDIDKDIEDILMQIPANLSLGIKIQSMETGDVLYENNPDRYFNPASTQKTITAAAALFYLGKDYQFKTAIYSDNKNIYIKFSGDPTLTIDDLNDLLQQLKAKGINNIVGDIYIDNTRFDNLPYSSGSIWDDANSCFSAPVNAIILNHNCFDATLIPGKSVNDKTQIMADDDLIRYTPIINQVVMKQSISTDDDECVLDVDVDTNNNYYLTGCLSPKSSKQLLSFAVRYIKPYISKLLPDLLKQQRISLRGKIRFGATPPGAREVASHLSMPLNDMINIMLKKSDNLIADVIFKTIGAEYYQQQGNWLNGARAISAILLEHTKLDFSNGRIVDGSGLSRYNLVTPDEFSQLLYVLYHDKNIGGDFVEGLPIAGVDGTLANKIHRDNQILHASIQAKTGTMAGVLSLAGYVYTKNNHVLSIVIIMNNFPGKANKYFYTEMRIAEYLIKNF